MRLCGNLTKVLWNKKLQAQFKHLCPAAVKCCLQCEDLKLDSENCVLLLLDAWMKGPRGSSSEPGTQADLAGCVRVCCLDRTFFLQVLPTLPWFVLTEQQRNSQVMYYTLTDQEKKMVRPPPKPDAWYKGRRRGLVKGEEHVLQVEVSAEQLQAWEAGSTDSSRVLLCLTHAAHPGL